MTDRTDLICIFTGSLVDVKYYKKRLEEIGVASLLKDDFSSGAIVGIGGVLNTVNLMVGEDDEEKAIACIKALQNKD